MFENILKNALKDSKLLKSMIEKQVPVIEKDLTDFLQSNQPEENECENVWLITTKENKLLLLNCTINAQNEIIKTVPFVFNGVSYPALTIPVLISVLISKRNGGNNEF